MASPGTPRFRFRAPDGTEVPVGSVEDLSSRLEAGELGPETPLFDAGTGSWARAGDVPVFQFVLEELRAEGRLPEEDDLVVLPDPPPEDPIDPGAAFEPIRHDAGAPTPAGGLTVGPTVDPFELHMPLSNPLDPSEGRDPERADRGGSGGDAGTAALPVPADGPEGDRDPAVEDGEAEALKEPWFEDRPFTEAEGEVAKGADDEGASEAAAVRPPGLSDTEGDTAPEAPSAAAGGEETPPMDPDIDPSPLHAWLTHGAPPQGGAATQERETATPDPAADAPGRRSPEGFDGGPGGGTGGPSRAPGRGATPGGEASGTTSGATERVPSAEREGPPIEIRTAWEDEADAEDPRAARLAARRRRRNARALAGMIAGTILIVGGAAIFTTTRAPAEPADVGPYPGSLSGDPGTDPSVAVDGITPPSGLETPALLLWRDLPAQISVLVDSIRVDAELSDAPPRDWLGGYYLANAAEFPEVVEFWEAYRGFVGRIAIQDAEIARMAARRAMGMDDAAPREYDELAGADRQRLVDYVSARHERMRPARVDRFLHLQRTADAALGLHAFLVENGASITHSPAIGRGVSADPVLEAVTETTAVRREMEYHLDRIFEALDRTRGGGQPSLAGLRSELFGSLGRPL